MFILMKIELCNIVLYVLTTKFKWRLKWYIPRPTDQNLFEYNMLDYFLSFIKGKFGKKYTILIYAFHVNKISGFVSN